MNWGRGFLQILKNHSYHICRAHIIHIKTVQRLARDCSPPSQHLTSHLYDSSSLNMTKEEEKPNTQTNQHRQWHKRGDPINTFRRGAMASKEKQNGNFGFTSCYPINTFEGSSVKEEGGKSYRPLPIEEGCARKHALFFTFIFLKSKKKKSPAF